VLQACSGKSLSSVAALALLDLDILPVLLHHPHGIEFCHVKAALCSSYILPAHRHAQAHAHASWGSLGLLSRAHLELSGCSLGKKVTQQRWTHSQQVATALDRSLLSLELRVQRRAPSTSPQGCESWSPEGNWDGHWIQGLGCAACLSLSTKVQTFHCCVANSTHESGSPRHV
jgi:hypothetical protein